MLATTRIAFVLGRNAPQPNIRVKANLMPNELSYTYKVWVQWAFSTGSPDYCGISCTA